MVIVAYSGEQQYRNYLDGRIRDAKAALDKLSILKILTNEFKSLETPKRIENIFFWKCPWAESGIGGQPDIPTLVDVTELEDFLKTLDVLHWPSEKKGAIVAKLQSNALEMSHAGYTEMVVAGNLAAKFGSSKLEYEPVLNSGGFSDIKLDYDGQPIYFEVTALNVRETERKFTEIFNRVAEHVWAHINRGVCVHIEIDTAVLPVSSEGIDVDASVNAITNFLKITNMISLFVNEFSLDGLKYFAQLNPSRSLYDQREMLEHYSTELHENIEAEPFRSFAKGVTSREFVNCPVTYFWCVPGKHGVVEVAEQEVSPSPVSSLEHGAFLRHVVRRLGEELEQLQPGEINIIVLRASNWSLFGYEKGHVEEKFVYDALRSTIEKFMHDSAVPDLSAVVVYEDRFSSGQIVMNSSASGKSKTTYEFIEKIIR